MSPAQPGNIRPDGTAPERGAAPAPLDSFGPLAAPLRIPLADVHDTVAPEPGAEVVPQPEADGERTCAFEAFVNVVGTLLVVGTVLLLLIDRVRPIFLAKP